MATYFMLGKYSPGAIKKMSSRRTDAAVGVIEQYNGQVVSIYALMGEYDIVFIINLPGNKEAMEVSVALTRTTNIFFTTCPAMPVDRYDAMIQDHPVDAEIAHPVHVVDRLPMLEPMKHGDQKHLDIRNHPGMGRERWKPDKSSRQISV